MIDGVRRSPEVERTINEAFARVFASDGGNTVLDYLHSITLGWALPPGQPNEVLQHLEGQRFIVALIKRRIEDGRAGKPGDAEPDAAGTFARIEARRNAGGGLAAHALSTARPIRPTP